MIARVEVDEGCPAVCAGHACSDLADTGPCHCSSAPCSRHHSTPRPLAAALMSSLFGSSGAARKSNYNKADDAGASREERMNRLKFELREHIRFLAGQSASRRRADWALHCETLAWPRERGRVTSAAVTEFGGEWSSSSGGNAQPQPAWTRRWPAHQSTNAPSSAPTHPPTSLRPLTAPH